MALRRSLKMHKFIVELKHDEIAAYEQSIEDIKDLHTWSCLHECVVTTAS